MTEDLLLPEINELTESFWQGCQQQRLTIQRCKNSQRLLHPPRYVSPWDNSSELDWVTVSGRGTVWSKASPHGPLTPQFSELAPYNIIIVALEEDPYVRLVGNLVADETAGINSVNIDDINIGDPVKVVFQKVTEDFNFPRWVLDTPPPEE